MTGVFWLFRHCVGIDDGLVAKLFQSGIGTAAPTQTSCASVVLKPAWACAVLGRVLDIVPRKTPMPPRSTTAGGAKPRWPKPCCSAAGIVHEKPKRGVK